MMGHKISFNEEIWIIIPKLSLLLLLILSTGTGLVFVRLYMEIRIALLQTPPNIFENKMLVPGQQEIII